jgi:hypothetical protein
MGIPSGISGGVIDTNRRSWPDQRLDVLGAGVDGPPLALAVNELAVADCRFPTVRGVADAVVHESEALTGHDGEGFGVVGHVADGSRMLCRVHSGSAERPWVRLHMVRAACRRSFSTETAKASDRIRSMEGKGADMDKSPRKTASKKSGKTLKEKRQAKKDKGSRKG